jgi:hypothetical protein
MTKNGVNTIKILALTVKQTSSKRGWGLQEIGFDEEF